MVFKKLRKISVDNSEISVLRVGNEDYISLTDMIRNLEGDDHIRNWMRTRETIEFLGLWEHMYNPDFNPVEFDGFKIWIVELLPITKQSNFEAIFLFPLPTPQSAISYNSTQSSSPACPPTAQTRSWQSSTGRCVLPRRGRT